MAPVFADLFDEEGAEVYKRGLDVYCLREGRYEWSQVQETARRRGELLLGWGGGGGGLQVGLNVVVPPGEYLR